MYNEFDIGNLVQNRCSKKKKSEKWGNYLEKT